MSTKLTECEARRKFMCEFNPALILLPEAERITIKLNALHSMTNAKLVLGKFGHTTYVRFAP